MAMVRTYFCIIGKGDIPIFELPVGHQAQPPSKQLKDDLIQFVLHASLDLVDQKVSTSNTMQLKVVDKFQDWSVSAFVSASKLKFLLLHEPKVDENATRAFFGDVYEHLIKVIMNPFYEPNSPIVSHAFEEKVRGSAKRFFPK